MMMSEAWLDELISLEHRMSRGPLRQETSVPKIAGAMHHQE
jgi:hypothetical protein